MNHNDVKPAIKPDPLYQMLRQEDVDAFNSNRDTLDTSHLKSGDYRGRDLRKLNARGLDFSNALLPKYRPVRHRFPRDESRRCEFTGREDLGSLFS